MSSQEETIFLNQSATGLQAVNRRRFLLGMVFLVALMMVLYALTDGGQAGHDPVLATADWAGYALCHRITERSFVINGRQFPLCARCTGMYLGAALAALVLLLAGRSRRVLLPPRRLFVALLALIALMGVDGVNSYSHFFANAPHLYEPRNWLRLATGMGAGLTMGIIVCTALAQALWRHPQFKPVLRNGRELLALISLAIVAVALVLSNQAPLLYVLALVSTGGLLFVVASLNTAVLLILLHRDGRLDGWAQAALPLAAGLSLGIMELSAAAYLRWSITGVMAGFPGL